MSQSLARIAAALLLAPSLGLWAEPAEKSSSELFTDVSLQAGITWKHFNGQSRDCFLIEASCGGVAFLDFDNDGRLDIYFVNGGETPNGKSPSPVRNALYRNRGNGKFEDVAESAEVAFYGMGAASAGYDNDGDMDGVFVRLNERPVLLRNNTGQEGAWIGFELHGRQSNRDAIGSKLSLMSGDKRFTRWLTGGASFPAFHDKRVIFGLGKPLKKECRLEIRWPSGKVQTVPGLDINRYHKIVEPDEVPGGSRLDAGDGKDSNGSVNP